jgi:protein gp37
MGTDTTISWTSATWNPVRGCTRVSAGCENCYAERVAARFSGPGLPYEGLARIGKNGARWTGKVRMVPEHLADPLRWKKPRRIFVNSMSDLFHEGLTNEEIAAVFGVMAAAPRHTFQVLTKRPERMRDWFRFHWVPDQSGRCVTQAEVCRGEAMNRIEHRRPDGSALPGPTQALFGYDTRWPLPNVWIGCSVENQATADERIPLLLETPAAVRWISAEPLLGPVDLQAIQIPGAQPGLRFSALQAHHDDRYGQSDTTLDWVVAGGESGPGARPCANEWLERIVTDCRGAEVPVFVKQLGSYFVSELRTADADAMNDPAKLKPTDFAPNGQVWAWRAGLKDRKGGDIEMFPEPLRVREFPR